MSSENAFECMDIAEIKVEECNEIKIESAEEFFFVKVKEENEENAPENTPLDVDKSLELACEDVKQKIIAPERTYGEENLTIMNLIKIEIRPNNSKQINTETLKDNTFTSKERTEVTENSLENDLLIERTKRFVCGKCNLSFATKIDLVDHNMKHKKKGKRNKIEYNYSCSICDKKYSEKRYLTKHQENHYLDILLTCQYCAYHSTKVIIFKRHLRKHSREPSNQRKDCQYCQFTTKRPGVFKLHMLEHSEELPYGCQYCPFRFKHKFSLRQHLLLHIDEKCVCQYCPFVAKAAGLLKTHIKAKHPHGKRTFNCDINEDDNVLPSRTCLGIKKGNAEPSLRDTEAVFIETESTNLDSHLIKCIKEENISDTLDLNNHFSIELSPKENLDVKQEITEVSEPIFTKEALIISKDIKIEIEECNVGKIKTEIDDSKTFLSQNNLKYSRKKHACQYCPMKFRRASHLRLHLYALGKKHIVSSTVL